MFAIWEGWKVMDAAYFCFVTISTIGFGDFVPGAAKGRVSEEDTLILIIASIYIVFGLAIIAMAFSLIQVSSALRMGCIKCCTQSVCPSVPCLRFSRRKAVRETSNLVEA